MKKRTLIFIMIIFSAICVLLFNLSYMAARNIAVSKLNDEQMIHARQAANGIEEYFRTWTGVLSSIAKRDDIIRTTAGGRHDMRLLYESHQEQIRSITRVDENGVILYSYPVSNVIGDNISAQPHMRMILRERKPVVSDVFKTIQGFNAVALHVPVFRGNGFKGTIAIVINFESLARRNLEVIRIGETGHAWVVSRDGTQLYSTIPGFAGKSVYDNYRDNPSILVMVKDMLRGHEGSAVYTSDRVSDRIVGPAKRYAVYTPIRFGNTFWSIVVNAPEEEALSGLKAFRNSLVLVMCVIFIGGVLLSVVGAKAWLIVREEEKRKKIESDLLESERRYRDLFERNPAPMLIYQRGTLNMLAVNDAFVYHYGYSSEQALALRLTDLYPDDEKGPVSDLSLKLKGHAYAGEWHHVKADGSVINIVARSHDIDYWGNDARIAVITDITDLKKTEAELEKHRLHLEEMVTERTEELILSQTKLNELFDDVKEVNKELAEANRRTEAANNKLKELDRLKSMFIASMSHELRTPLNSIIGFTGIILQGMTGEINNEQRDQLQRVLKAGRHLLALITDVIDISKIEAGKIEAYVEEFQLDGLINEALSNLKLQIKEKDLEIEVRAAPIMLKTDRKRLFQSVLNYISNAVKYSERGKISLVAEEKGDILILNVTDTGIGIKEEDLPKLFNSFVRLDPNMKMTVSGTGLGLYLTRKLVTEVLGGEVSATSTYGKGSTFTLSIPKHLKNRPGEDNLSP